MTNTTLDSNLDIYTQIKVDNLKSQIENLSSDEFHEILEFLLEYTDVQEVALEYIGNKFITTWLLRDINDRL